MDGGKRGRYPIVVFYLLAFGISWAGYVPVLACDRGVAFFASRLWLGFLILPGVGPALAAWLATFYEGTARRFGEDVWGSLRRSVDWRWWVIAGVGPACLFLASNALSRWLLPGRPVAQAPDSGLTLGLVVAMSVAANPWEEIGWRGFALTRLQEKMRPVAATLVVGVLWALWHVPLFLWTRSPMSRMPFAPWAIRCVAGAFIYTWLYNSTRRSLAVVMVFHVCLNVFGAVIGDGSEVVLMVVEVAVAVVLVGFYGRELTCREGRTG